MRFFLLVFGNMAVFGPEVIRFEKHRYQQPQQDMRSLELVTKVRAAMYYSTLL
jgi:hypothetical protein